MMCTIQVTAQYYENYSDTNIPYWKPKGGVDFHFPLDADMALYARREDLVLAITKMVEEQSNDYCLYEYIDHEVKFSSPVVVMGLENYLSEELV
jgi:hypothetical protein